MFKRFWWVFLVMAVALPVVGLLISATVNYVMPKKFESTATLQFWRIAPESLNRGIPEFQMLGNQMQAMRSNEILQKVAGNLELSNRWGYDTTEILQKLREVVRIEERRGTEFIDIVVRHTNKEDARDIAAELARTYRQSLEDAAKVTSEKVLAGLRETQAKLEKQIDELDQVEASSRYRFDGSPGPDKLEWDSVQGELMETKNRIKLEELSQRISVQMFVRSEPVIGTMPVSPNVRFNLLSGLIGGLVLSPLLSLPLIWLLNGLIIKPCPASSAG